MTAPFLQQTFNNLKVFYKDYACWYCYHSEYFEYIFFFFLLSRFLSCYFIDLYIKEITSFSILINISFLISWPMSICRKGLCIMFDIHYFMHQNLIFLVVCEAIKRNFQPQSFSTEKELYCISTSTSYFDNFYLLLVIVTYFPVFVLFCSFYSI